MSISTLSKINIFFHDENKEQLIRRLQELACIHVIDFKQSFIAESHEDLVIKEEISDPKLEKRLNNLNFAITCLSPFRKENGLLSMMAGKKVILSKKEYKEILKSFDESDIVKKVILLEKEEHALLSEITNNETVMRELEPWESLDINIEEIQDTNTTCVRIGKIAAGKLAILKESIETLTCLYDIHEVNTVGESVYAIICFMKEFEDAVEDVLTISGFERKDFRQYSGKITQIIKRYEDKDEKDDERLARIGTELTELAKELPKLKIVYDNLFNEHYRDKIKQNFGKTDTVSLIEGYIDDEDFTRLKDTVEGEFKFAQVEKAPIKEGDIVPTKLKNKNITKSFEIVLDLYGMPSVKSFDPTVYLMPFFAVFFGLCLTDGAYGVMLVILSLVLIKKYKPIFGSSKLMWVLMVSGFATIGVGIITGGWFGDIIEYLPDSFNKVKDFKNSLVLFDPMKDSMVFFAISVALGYLHLLFGLLLSFIKHVKDGQLIDGLCTKMTWIVFLVSVVLWVLAVNGVVPQSVGTAGKWVFIASCAAIVFFSEREAKSMGVRFASGFYNLYGATSYVGDVLSYLRLLALGLASGVIAVVINVICKLALGIPYAGIIVAILIFVGGHVFNLVISSLGAFVHTLRLNYAEFFPKFFEGGGKFFTPFKLESSFAIFSDEADTNEN